MIRYSEEIKKRLDEKRVSWRDFDLVNEPVKTIYDLYMEDMEKKEKENMNIHANDYQLINPNDILVKVKQKFYRIDSIENTHDPLSINNVYKIKFSDSPSRFVCDYSAPAKPNPSIDLRIDKVIFNGPATVILWKDGTKTTVKNHNDNYDPEKAVAMAIAKKALGNQGNYYNTIRKALEDAEVYNRPAVEMRFGDFILANLLNAMNKPTDQEEKNDE